MAKEQVSVGQKEKFNAYAQARQDMSGTDFDRPSFSQIDNKPHRVGNGGLAEENRHIEQLREFILSEMPETDSRD